MSTRKHWFHLLDREKEEEEEREEECPDST